MSNENPPFFSVCMPVVNRGETIFSSLCSIARQKCRDFEVVIVDCGSVDSSRTEIERFFTSEEYRTAEFPYRYEQQDYFPVTVEDWNEPVRLATGRYVAMLEGDDSWLPEYLQTAYDKLSANPGIGIYATGNQLYVRQRQGYIEPASAARFMYTYTEVPPPSETIFVRTDHAGQAFLYNDTDYEYAPEVDLYIRIALDGYGVFFDDRQHTVRNISTKDRTTWHYFHDGFVVANKYASIFEKQVCRVLRNLLLRRVIDAMFSTREKNTVRDLRDHLIREVGWIGYVRALVCTVGRKLLSRIQRLS